MYKEKGQSAECNTADRSRKRRVGRRPSDLTTQRSFVTMTSTISVSGQHESLTGVCLREWKEGTWDSKDRKFYLSSWSASLL